MNRCSNMDEGENDMVDHLEDLMGGSRSHTGNTENLFGVNLATSTSTYILLKFL